MNGIQRFFSVPAGNRSDWDVVLWWESRRLAYNLVVGIPGILSLLLFEACMSRPGMLKPGEDAVEPLAILAAPVILNICYTAGWLVELLFRRVRAEREPSSPKLMAAGLGFSLLVVLLPTILCAL